MSPSESAPQQFCVRVAHDTHIHPTRCPHASTHQDRCTSAIPLCCRAHISEIQSAVPVAMAQSAAHATKSSRPAGLLDSSRGAAHQSLAAHHRQTTACCDTGCRCATSAECTCMGSHAGTKCKYGAVTIPAIISDERDLIFFALDSHRRSLGSRHSCRCRGLRLRDLLRSSHPQRVVERL